jgi:polyisoprenoid-binding protein YceI
MRPALALAPGTWAADRARSSVGFHVEGRPAGILRGRFDDFAAHLAVREGGQARLFGSAHAGSLVLPGAGGAVRGAAALALDVGRFPRMTFESSALDVFGDLVQVDGLLTVRGTTLSVTAAGRLVPADGGSLLVLTLETVVDRRQFGVEGLSPPPGRDAVFGHETRLHAELVLHRTWAP